MNIAESFLAGKKDPEKNIYYRGNIVKIDINNFLPSLRVPYLGEKKMINQHDDENIDRHSGFHLCSLQESAQPRFWQEKRDCKSGGYKHIRPDGHETQVTDGFRHKKGNIGNLFDDQVILYHQAKKTHSSSKKAIKGFHRSGSMRFIEAHDDRISRYQLKGSVLNNFIGPHSLHAGHKHIFSITHAIHLSHGHWLVEK